MRLDEMITHITEVQETCNEKCNEEHQQLKEYLYQLKELKEILGLPDEKINLNVMRDVASHIK